ncbi:MAG: hypothetical protein M1839_002556 [Geoglossum umbratile]|nr:MAG: hypothetical protein M1839_002556 [Geoglossum umbratile]
MYFPLRTLFCIFLFCISAFASVEENLAVRSLTAVTGRSRHLLERGVVDFAPQWSSEFHYVDEDTLGTGSPFAARLGFASKLPVLALEDIEVHLDTVRCSKTTIEISFRSGHHHSKAKAAWEKLEKFLVVTSHLGCNYNGERSPYLVSGVTFSEGRPAVILSTQIIDWKDTFHTMSVDFGTSSEAYTPEHLRRHGSLQRRQGKRGASTEASPTSSGSPSQTFPVAPTDVPSATSATKDLSFSQLSTQIFPPTFAGASLIAPQGWTVSCKNCSAKGSIEVTQGSFTVISNSNDSFTKFMDFLHSGFITLTAESFSAHIELDTAVQTSQTLHEVEVHLLAVPIAITPFQIPGIAAIGAFFDPLLVASITINEAFNFTSGFDLSVPDQSYVTLDIGNVTNSSTAGFGKTQVKTLPFRSTAPSIDLTFSAGFRPQVLLGVQVLEGIGQADINFFLDLPQVSVTIERLTNVPGTCIASNATNIGNQLGHIFGNLTHISPNVQLDVGVGLAAEFQVAGVGSSIETDWTIASTAFPLPTACLSYDPKAKSYAPAGDPPATTTTSADGNKAKKALGARARNPLEGRWHVCGAILAVVLMAL